MIVKLSEKIKAIISVVMIMAMIMPFISTTALASELDTGQNATQDAAVSGEATSDMNIMMRPATADAMLMALRPQTDSNVSVVEVYNYNTSGTYSTVRVAVKGLATDLEAVYSTDYVSEGTVAILDYGVKFESYGHDTVTVTSSDYNAGSYTVEATNLEAGITYKATPYFTLCQVTDGVVSSVDYLGNVLRITPQAAFVNGNVSTDSSYYYNTTMGYRIKSSNSNIDVHGMYEQGGSPVGSSYWSGGWALSTNNSSATYWYTPKISVIEVDDSIYDVVELVVTLRNNTSDTLTGINFAIHADTEFDGNDRVPLTRTAYGYYMDNSAYTSSSGAGSYMAVVGENGYGLISKNILTGRGIEETRTTWVGNYSDRYSNLYTNSEIGYTYTGDSGSVSAVQDVTLEPGDIKQYSIKFLLTTSIDVVEVATAPNIPATDITTDPSGNGSITVAAQEGETYIITDEEGNPLAEGAYVIATEDGETISGSNTADTGYTTTGFYLYFTGLERNKNYKIIAMKRTGDKVLTAETDINVPAVDPETVEGTQDGDEVTVIINPSTVNMKYAIADKDGNIVTAWQDGNGGALEFVYTPQAGCLPYTVVAIDVTEPDKEQVPDAGAQVDAVVPLVASQISRPVDGNYEYIYIEAPFVATQEYGLVDAEGNELAWQRAPQEGIITFGPLDSTEIYGVVTRVIDVEKYTEPIMTQVVLPVEEWDIVTELQEDGAAYVSVENTKAGNIYAIIDENNNVLAQKESDGEDIIFNDVMPDKEYIIVNWNPSISVPSDPAWIAGTAVFAPPVTDDDITKTIENIDDIHYNMTFEPATTIAQYVLVDGDSNIVQVIMGSGSSITFTGLEYGKEYGVLMVPADTDIETEGIYDAVAAGSNKTVASVAEMFVKEYLTDEDGNIVRITSENAQRITELIPEWNKLSNNSKGKVNEILSDEAGVDFQQMLVQASVYSLGENGYSIDRGNSYRYNTVVTSTTDYVQYVIADVEGNIITDIVQGNNGSITFGGFGYGQGYMLLAAPVGTLKEEMINKGVIADVFGIASVADIFVQNNLVNEEGNLIDTENVTAGDVEKLLNAIPDWNALALEQQNIINEALTEETGKNVDFKETLLNAAEYGLGEPAVRYERNGNESCNIVYGPTSGYVGYMLVDKDGNPVSEVKTGIGEEIVFEELSYADSYKVVAVLAGTPVENIMNSLSDRSSITVPSVPELFVAEKLTDKDGNPIEPTDDEKAKQLLDTLPDWNELTPEQQEEVNRILTEKTGKETDLKDEFVDAAERGLEEPTAEYKRNGNEFCNITYGPTSEYLEYMLVDEDGNPASDRIPGNGGDIVFENVPYGNSYKVVAILAGTPEENIDTSSSDKDELTVPSAAELFVKENLTDEDGNIIDITPENINQIFDSIKDFETLTPEQQEEVNKILSDKKGDETTFDDIVVEAGIYDAKEPELSIDRDNVSSYYNMKFGPTSEKAQYAIVDEEGNIVSEVIAGDGDDIIFTNLEYGKSYQLIVAVAGTPVEEMAEKGVVVSTLNMPGAPELFVKNYLTDEEGNLIEITEENAQQIVDALPDWNILSAGQKATIDAILSRLKGDKVTFDDFLHEAHEYVPEEEKESDEKTEIITGPITSEELESIAAGDTTTGGITVITVGSDTSVSETLDMAVNPDITVETGKDKIVNVADNFKVTISVDAKTADAKVNVNEILKAVLTEKVVTNVNVGNKVEIRMTVEDNKIEVNNTDKGYVEEKLNEGYTVGGYYDISMYLVVNDEAEEKITETTDKIKVVLNVPEELKSDTERRVYEVIRVHYVDGVEVPEVVILPDLDDNEDTITIETDRFSVYAISYKVTENGTTAVPTGDSANTGIFVILALLSGAALTVTAKKRKTA